MQDVNYGTSGAPGNNDGEPIRDVLFEKEKKALCTALAVFAFLSIPFAAVPMNSKFLEPFFANILPAPVYQLLLMAGMLLLGIYACMNRNTVARSKKAAFYREQLAKADNMRWRRDVSLDEALHAKNGLESFEAKERRRNIVLFFLAVFCLLFLILLFSLSGFEYAAREMSKPEIDRTIGNFRLIVDAISSLCFTVSLCFLVCVLPFLMRNRTLVPDPVLFLMMAVSIFSAIHFAYFFFGNFTHYPSIMDFCAFAVSSITAGFFGISVATEKKKKLLREFSGGQFGVY